MNDKFSELYHRAWTLAEFDDEYKEKPTYERRCVVQSRIFAELIVQECVDIADEYDGAGSTIVGRIKKHFGVE